jgi:hypothetical protein
MATETVLQHLTKPNVTLVRLEKSSTKTMNRDWAPVENIAPWTNFTFENLVNRYWTDLVRLIESYYPVPQCEKVGFNNLFDERGLSDVVT